MERQCMPPSQNTMNYKGEMQNEGKRCKVPSPGTMLWLSPSVWRKAATVWPDWFPVMTWAAWERTPWTRRAKTASDMPSAPPAGALLAPCQIKQQVEGSQCMSSTHLATEHLTHHNHANLCIRFHQCTCLKYALISVVRITSPSASLNVKTKQLINDILPQMPACFLVATRIIMHGSNEILNSIVNSQCFASNQRDAWVGTAETEMLQAVFPFSSFTHTFTYSLYIKPVFIHIDFICFQAWFIKKKWPAALMGESTTRCSQGTLASL